MMNEITFGAGEEIIQENELGGSAYLIISGSVEVSRIKDETRTILAVLEAGQLFGEMALVDEKPRSATITALEDCAVLEITRDTMMHAIKKSPEMVQSMVAMLVDRVRGLDQALLLNGVEMSQAAIGSVTLSGANQRTAAELGETQIVLKSFPFRVGRKSSKTGLFSLHPRHLLLEDHPPYSVSRNHFSITRCHEDIFVVDEGSTVGTLVNGTRIGGPTPLREVRCDQEQNLIVIGNSETSHQLQLTIERE